MSKLLVESTAVPQATQRPGVWRAVLLTPGKGSSGTYSESMLREFGNVALRKGAKSFVTHNRLENGEPDPFQMWGFLTEDAHYEDGVGLVGDIEVLPSWRDRVEEVAPHTALSVYVAGEVDENGNVVELYDDPQNGVDMVVYPGRPGSGLVEKLYETAVKDSANADSGLSTDSADPSKKENRMTFEEMLESLSERLSVKLAEAVDAASEKIAERLVERLSESAGEVENPLDVAEEVANAVAEANLPKEARKRVFASVKGGADVTEAVKAEKDYVVSIAESLGAPKTDVNGRIVEGETKKFSLTALREAGSN